MCKDYDGNGCPMSRSMVCSLYSGKSHDIEITPPYPGNIHTCPALYAIGAGLVHRVAGFEIVPDLCLGHGREPHGGGLVRNEIPSLWSLDKRYPR